MIRDIVAPASVDSQVNTREGEGYRLIKKIVPDIGDVTLIFDKTDKSPLH